jgi:hypothetical protein
MKQSQLKQIIKEEVQKVINTEEDNLSHYMFFEDLKAISRMAEEILTFDFHQVDELLSNGHDWAEDHISSAETKLGEVTGFLKNHLENTSLTEGAYEDAMANLNTKVGVKVPTAKNTFKEKEFKVEYWQYINDEYDFDFIIVKAKDEADALVKAKEELKKSGKRNVRYDKLKVIK